MKSDGLFRPLAISFLIAAATYFVFYTGIEHRRVRKGPWQVAFTTRAGKPALVINQPVLQLTNIQIISAAGTATNATGSFDFSQPREVPYDVPYGQCVFMDTTFLPGTLVLDWCGHEIQLLPRVLTIDRQEQAWKSGAEIVLPAVSANAGTRPPAPK